ncbi:hypothetical protein TNCV_879991 [Trichonephila clavipes]|nr:hypothetical protein TNCV_879991 [Trichonephila clavipes]
MNFLPKESERNKAPTKDEVLGPGPWARAQLAHALRRSCFQGCYMSSNRGYSTSGLRVLFRCPSADFVSWAALALIHSPASQEETLIWRFVRLYKVKNLPSESSGAPTEDSSEEQIPTNELLELSSDSEDDQET